MEATTWKGWSPLLLILLATLLGYVNCATPYYGKFLGNLKTLHHGVTGEVYAVDARTLHIRDFSYDGEGPAAYFWAGDTKSPSSYGFKVNDEKGSPNVLPRYKKKHITLTLPDNKTLKDIKWFSVWCDEFAVNFGDVKIPENFDYPKPKKIDALNGAHQVSSDNIVVVDAQTLLVPNFSYDGEAPDAKFWVGKGRTPGPHGTRLADENGLETPLRRYDRKTVVLTLPGDMTVHEIGHFGIWCEAFAVDFGHVRIPRNLVVPPSLKMLGVSAQKRPRSPEISRPLQFDLQQLQSYTGAESQATHGFDRGQTNSAPPRSFRISDYPDETRLSQPTTYRPQTSFLRRSHEDSVQIIPSVSLTADEYADQQQRFFAAQRRSDGQARPSYDRYRN